MNKKNILLFSLLLPIWLAAETFPGVPRDSNFGNTAGYDGTRVEAKLVMMIRDDTNVVHFIRDNNDPRVVTKTYLLKNVDAYEFRDYIRQFVQVKRVGNTALQQVFPGNSGNVATVSSAQPVSPANAQPTYSPQLQLGSNTAVECLKYVDGTGLLLISAEEYRFQSNENGMGFDELVEFLDKPQMGASYGTQTFFYLPKFVPAVNLQSLIQNVGMNITDASELWQGMDVVARDPDLNWLIFDVTNYSMSNIEKMLALYDVPIPQVRLKITVYEILAENDRKLGVDFQAWKNNDGIDFFSAGGRYRDNWSGSYGGGLLNNGGEATQFYNFNPKWSTRYLDFLQSRGDARINCSGELLIRNNCSAVMDRTTQIFYAAKVANEQESTPAGGAGYYWKLLSSILNQIVSPDYPVGKADTEIAAASESFGFTLTVNNASVTGNETCMNLTLKNSSLLGFNSDGSPRISDDATCNLTVSLPHNKNRFVIGSLHKYEVVKSDSGVPLLMDIPYLGYLFKTEAKSVKRHRLLVIGECSYDSVPVNPAQPAKSRSNTR